MELELEDGNKISLNPDSKVHIGRNLGFKSDFLSKDRTISCKHLSLHLVDDPIEKYVIKFEVVGKNPIWIHRISDGERRIYRKFEMGELRSGDEFSLSIKKPVLCVVKKKEGEIDEDEVSFEEIGRLDLSEIDPVKEFGFLVKGHEFDNYSKKQLPEVKKWNWFLEQTNDGSDVDDDDENTHASTSKWKKNKMRNTKKDGLEYDDEWTGDSEEENIVAVKGESSKRPKYFTRSKDSKRPRKNSSVSKNTSKMKNAEVDDDQLEEEGEEDETLGGFIVSEEEIDNEEEDDDESEEEFEDDDEDDD